MAGVPIKFRCYQCNQLLGASRAKVGSIITCPKCSTDLVVPDPDDPTPSAAPPTDPASPTSAGPLSASASVSAPETETTPAFLSALAAGLPIEIADIRPEDIRAESSIDWTPSPLPTESASSATAPAFEPFPYVAPPAPAPVAGDVRPAPVAVEPPPSPATVSFPTSPTIPVPIPVPPSPAVEPVVPPIKVEPPSLVPERPTVRARDLVLPRSVVASWSLFVLLAQALAFLAGLLAGHYIWRVH